MSSASTTDNDQRARAAITAVARQHTAQLLAALMRDIRDLQLAEDCLQDAIESAIVHWRQRGLPEAPPAWLLQVARRKAIDRLRRSRNFARKMPEYGALLALDQNPPEELQDIEDDRLRMIFTCCHPALEEKTRVALTLRTLCGLTTQEIARAFLDSEEAMAQRLVRARQKISKAGIAYEVPGPEAWPARLDSVLAVIYLVFNEGYAATAGEARSRIDLCEEAIRLARLLAALHKGDAEIEGLLALLLLIHARAPARLSAAGEIIALEEQDRSRWNRELIADGTALLGQALARRRPGVYQTQAAINALHCEAESHTATNWQEIVLLYNHLHATSGNPVFLLNGAVALSWYSGAEDGLRALALLEPELHAYQPFHAARADMFRRLGRWDEARQTYETALAMSRNAGEQAFLRKRRDSCDP
ncbi:MAG: sigma-70 family RNA polymerase sigma factor [Hyphomicrobiales bacterium]